MKKILLLMVMSLGLIPYLHKGKITLATTHAYAYGDEDDNYGWGQGQTIDDVEDWLNEHGIDYTIDGVYHNNSGSGYEGSDYNANFEMSNDEWVAATSQVSNSVANYVEGLLPGNEISATFYNSYLIGTEYEQSFKAIPHYDCTQAEFDDYQRYKQGVGLGLWWEVDPPKIIYYTYEFTGNASYRSGTSYYDDWLSPRQPYGSGNGSNTIYDLYGGGYHFLNYLPFTQNLLRNIRLPKDQADYLDQQLHGDPQLESALNDFLVSNNYNRIAETALSVTIRAMMDNSYNVINPSGDKQYQFLSDQDNDLTDMVSKGDYLSMLRATYNADPSVVGEIRYLHAIDKIIKYSIEVDAAKRECAEDDTSITADKPTPTSTKDDALRYMDTQKWIFDPVNRVTTIWKNIDPQKYLNNVIANINNPDRVNQGWETAKGLDDGTDFCGLAAACNNWIKTDPKGYSTVMMDLYTRGSSLYNDKTLQVDDAVKQYAGTLKQGSKDPKVATLKDNHADQLIFLTLASTFKCYLNIDRGPYQPRDESRPFWAGSTLGKFDEICHDLLGYTVKTWGSDISLTYATEAEKINYMITQQLKGTVFLFVNGPTLRGENPAIAAPATHFVKLIDIHQVSINPNRYSLTYWDYGMQTQRVYTYDEIFKFLYGVITLEVSK